MAIITLLTDFGLNDNFAGVIKGVMLRINPKIQIVDISHNINPQDILEGAILLANSFKFFPKGAIHMAVVDPGVGSERRPILVKAGDYFFIAPDNGILSLALKDEKVKKIIHLTNKRFFLKPVSDTFHGRDIFAPVAAYFSLGRRIGDFGRPIKKIKNLELPEVRFEKDLLIGEVIYIDRFGNLVTNIRKENFNDFVGKRDFVIEFKGILLDTISGSYSERDRNSPLAIWDSFSYLEIAINQGSAKESFSARIGSKVYVKVSFR